MKVYWINKKDNYTLAVEPASKLLTLERLPEIWQVTCLGQTRQYPKGFMLEDAKRLSVIWLKDIIVELKEGLENV